MPKKIEHKQVLPAVSKSLGEGRSTAFRENPSKETADAIVDVVRNNLYKLAGVKAGKDAKPAKAEKTEKPAKKPAAKTKAPAKAPAKAAKKPAKPEKTPAKAAKKPAKKAKK